MNTIGEIIDVEKLTLREMYLSDMVDLFKHYRMWTMSWGMSGLTVDDVKHVKMIRFKVRGHHHKGYVYIFLNGLDLFDVVLTNYKNKIVKRTEEMGIYVDQLMEWIDENVERISEYTV